MRLRRSLSCQEFVELASDYLDGTLSPALRRAVDRHLASCPDCPTYLDQLRTTIALTGRLRADDVHDDLLDVLQRAWDDEHGGRDRRDPGPG